MVAVAALLGGLLACRDSPTDIGGTVADRATQAVAPDALATIHDVVDDPLVHALVAGMNNEASRREVGRALSAVSRAAADGQPWAVDGALLIARHQVEREGAVDDEAVQAAFSLLLDHADAMLEDGRDAEEAEGAGKEVWR
jgi:5,10-methenyltetrahydromethanopterin hydrogenase